MSDSTAEAARAKGKLALGEPSGRWDSNPDLSAFGGALKPFATPAERLANSPLKAPTLPARKTCVHDTRTPKPMRVRLSRKLINRAGYECRVYAPALSSDKSGDKLA